jgi:hypothetical protein
MDNDRQLQGPAPTQQHNQRRWDWARPRRTRRGLIAVYLLTLAAFMVMGWADVLGRGKPGYGLLWLALLAAILVEQAALSQATRGLFRPHASALDEPQRAVRELGYRSGFRILASAATLVAAAAVWLPVGRLLPGTNRLAWTAIAIATLWLLWMLPTMVVAWIQPDDPDPDSQEADRTAAGGGGPASPPIRWRWVAVAAVLNFLIAIGVITAIEALTNQPLTSLIRGQSEAVTVVPAGGR